MATALLPSLCSCSSRSTQYLTASTPTEQQPPAAAHRRSRLQPIPSPAKARLGSPKRNTALVVARTLFSYVESGRMVEALALFESSEGKKPDAFLWNLMIRGYTNAELYEAAADFYYRMLAAGLRADNFTFPFVIKAFASLSLCDEGSKVHAMLIKAGLESDVFVGNSLIAMYGKLGLIDSAVQVFEEMPVRDCVSWNSMIDGYVLNGEAQLALQCFRELHEALGVRPDRFGIMGALAACSLQSLSREGRAIHCYVIRCLLDVDAKVQTSLLDMYCKCQAMSYAEKLFSAMSSRSVVTWNTLISGYTLNGQPKTALACFRKMQEENTDPDAVTLIGMLTACAQIQDLSQGKAIHCFAVRRGCFPHLILETAINDVYGKCGALKYAELLFEQMTVRSLVSWNTMIAAYIQKGMYEEAMELFVNLMDEPLEPDIFTVSIVMPAFVELMSLRQARQMHSYVVRTGYGSSTLVLNSIIYMYARCGDLKTAQEVFERMTFKDIISWNTIIMAYGIHSHGTIALDLFSVMKQNGLQPNESTFVSVLTACSISGLEEEGWVHFNSMQQEFSITPQVEHYGCIVDLLGRKRDLKATLEFIENMPIAPTSRIWGSLLTASRNSNNIEVAELAAEHIFQLEHDNTGCYVLLCSMYADAGRWEDVERIRLLMKEIGLAKTKATSFVELSGKTCSFVNGDVRHLQSRQIHEVSDIISEKIEEIGSDDKRTFNPNYIAAKKAASANRHCVRLGVIYGMISSEIGTPILVKKNVRICNLCHSAIKRISQFSGRKIIVGDARIYHHFFKGSCSCGDYW